MYREDFADRIDLVVERIGGITKASALIGVSYPTMGRWKEGTSDPKLSNVVALAKAANVSLDWLIHGIDNPHCTQQPVIEQTQPDIDDDYIHVPAYDVEVSAGHGSTCFADNTPTRHLAFRKRWVTARGLQADKLAALFTRGDSMIPTIPDGAAVIIDRRRTQALDGKVYVIRIDERHYVKRVQWLIGGGLRLISDNKLYDPLDITKDDMNASNVQICGQVIHASYDLPD